MDKRIRTVRKLKKNRIISNPTVRMATLCFMIDGTEAASIKWGLSAEIVGCLAGYAKVGKQASQYSRDRPTGRSVRGRSKDEAASTATCTRGGKYACRIGREEDGGETGKVAGWSS